MNEKQSSDELASLASRIQTRGNPLEDEAMQEIIVLALAESVKANVPLNIDRDKLLSGLGAVLGPFFVDMKSLAGSVLSQADGPEDRAPTNEGEVELLQMLREAQVKLVDVQGKEAPVRYAENLVKRIETRLGRSYP